MYKIHDFSKETGVSKDTLRYYDSIDLFKPSYVDIFSGYRYYEENQIYEIKKIIQLKEIGLSIEKIKTYLQTGENNLLIKKREEFTKMIKKIEEMLKESSNEYTISEGDYQQYVKVNGLKQETCPQALEVRDQNAFYFVVYKNGKLYTDFCVFKENHWLTLKNKYLFDKEFMHVVFDTLKKYVDSVRLYIPSEEEKTISFVKEFNQPYKLSDANQGNWSYKQIDIRLS